VVCSTKSLIARAPVKTANRVSAASAILPMASAAWRADFSICSASFLAASRALSKATMAAFWPLSKLLGSSFSSIRRLSITVGIAASYSRRFARMASLCASMLMISRRS